MGIAKLKYLYCRYAKNLYTLTICFYFVKPLNWLHVKLIFYIIHMAVLLNDQCKNDVIVHVSYKQLRIELGHVTLYILYIYIYI